MKIIYNGYMGREVKPFPEWDSEVQDAVQEAIMLVEGMHGFRTHFEIWRNCELIITIGHNIYTTSIEIRPPRTALIRRKEPTGITATPISAMARFGETGTGQKQY